jgi:CheY-like chemotaxis protein
LEAAAPRRRRVLLAEDGLVNQQVACGLLEARGHSVVIVNNGHEAVKALEQEPFDLVLMDVQMPELDGFEATKAIREQEKTTGRHVPIVAMTAHAMKGDRERCLQAGMDFYLTKPIQSKALFETVEGVAVVAEGPSDPPVETGTNDKVMDWNAAVGRIGGNENLLRQMAPIFFKEASVNMPALRKAITQEDVGQVRRLAHALKGSAACFAAPSVEAAALCLELMGRESDLAGADGAYALLEREMKQLEQALKTLVH